MVDNRGLKCVITKDDKDIGRYVYEDVLMWAGFKFQCPKRGGAKVYLKDIIATNKKAEDLLRDF